jgi:hypothetical protein
MGAAWLEASAEQIERASDREIPADGAEHDT